MNESATIAKLINQRFQALFLDLKSARLMVKNVGQPKLTMVEVEQNKTSRSLLSVEKRAIQQKVLHTRSNENLLAQITKQINLEVETRLEEEFKDTQHLYEKVLGLDNAFPELLDMVSVKAATISKIELVANKTPWLISDLMKFVNQRKYQRTDNQGNPIKVDNKRVALNFFGLENLNIIITSLAIKRALPQITEPYPHLKLRIWEEALATAMACKKLAGVAGIHQNHAFCLGMLQVLGKIIISKRYFKLFQEVQREALEKSQLEQKHQAHAALTKIDPSGAFLNDLISKKALGLSAAIIDRMQMKRVFIAHAMSEVANNQPAQNLSPLGLVLKQGMAYAKFRVLKKHKLIDLQLANDFIRPLNIPKGALQILKTTDLGILELLNANLR